MKATSRVQCYDNRDTYFFCLGAAPPRGRARARASACVIQQLCACGTRGAHIEYTDEQRKMVKTAQSANRWRRRCVPVSFAAPRLALSALFAWWSAVVRRR